MRLRAALPLALALCTPAALLLKLGDEEDGHGISGPHFPSATIAPPSVQPHLVVAYVVRTSGLFL